MATTDSTGGAGAQLADQASTFLLERRLDGAYLELADAWAELVEGPLGLALENRAGGIMQEGESIKRDVPPGRFAAAVERLRRADLEARAALDQALTLVQEEAA